MRAKMTYGSDPELFLQDIAKNKIVSSIPVLKRDKHNPIKLKDGVVMYADNVLCETAFPPANSKDEMVHRFRGVFKQIQGKLGKKYRMVPQAAHEFTKNDLKPQFGIDPMESGCNPSFDAWNATINEPKPFVNGFRTGSAHFHVGHDKLTDFDTRLNAIKVLDIYLGCSFVLIDKDETSKIRRQYYGLSSEHRPTEYGLEYRVLSPYVLKSPQLVSLALDIIDFSMEKVFKGESSEVIKLVNPVNVMSAINNCDAKLAQSVLNQAELPGDLMKRVTSQYKLGDFYQEWGI